MVAKDYSKTKGSGKAEVGEIDTSAPFQSVKDAVSLFGEGAFSGERPAIRKVKPHSAERVLAKETQLHLAEKELNKLKGQLENAETTKAEALVELDRSKRAVVDLTEKLKVIHESRDSAIASTQAYKQFTEMNESSNTDHETARAEYISASAELDAAKHDLRIIRQEYNLSLEFINMANQQADEAESAVNANTERAEKLSKEISSAHDSIEQANIEITRVKEEEKILLADKNEHKQLCKTKLEELEKKLVSLKRDINPEIGKNLEARLSETLLEIEVLKKEIEDAKGKDLDAIQTVALELGGAKGSLHKATDEENSLRSLVETLKVELDEIKKEHLGLKERELETESNAGNLHVKLRKAKSELEDAIAEEAKARGASDEMIVTLRQMATESRDSRREAEEMRIQADELKREAEAARVELEEAEEKLKTAVNEAEEAKAAEARALDRIKKLSEETDAARASTSSETGARIVISRDEFESLGRKAEERERLAEMQVEAAMAQVEAVRASESEAVKRLEACRKEIEEMKEETREASRKAEMAEAARKAVEGELRRWRERDEKKAVEAATRILEETERRAFEEKVKEVETHKLEKAKTISVGKKSLMPSLSGVFHKKKSSGEGGGDGDGSPSSYLPSEKKSVWWV